MKEAVDKDRSFACFVYPFLFDPLPRVPEQDKAASKASDDPFCVLAKSVAASTLDQKKIWTDWRLPANDLTPHVARFLDPAPDNTKPTGRFWQLDNDIAQKLQTSKIEWRMLRG